MSAAEKRQKAKTIRARYDGRCFVPEEPVDLEVGTPVEVSAAGEGPTFLEKRLGIRLNPRKGAPLLSSIIIEERGPI